MSTLSITKWSTYDYHSDKVFEYEHKWYMSNAWTNIKVLWNWTIKLTVDHWFRKNKEWIYDPKITEGRY